MAARSLLQLTERSNRSLFRRVTKPAEKHVSGLFFFSSKATYLQSVPFLSRTPPCFTCFCVKRKSYGLFSSCCNDQIILQPLKEVAQLPVGVCKKKKKKKGSGPCRCAVGPQEGHHSSPGPAAESLGATWKCPATCSKLFPVQGKPPWSFENQSWKGRDFRQGGIGKFLYIEII